MSLVLTGGGGAGGREELARPCSVHCTHVRDVTNKCTEGGLKCWYDPEHLGGLTLHPSTWGEVVVILHVVILPLMLAPPSRVAIL